MTSNLISPHGDGGPGSMCPRRRITVTPSDQQKSLAHKDIFPKGTLIKSFDSGKYVTFSSSYNIVQLVLKLKIAINSGHFVLPEEQFMHFDQTKICIHLPE